VRGVFRGVHTHQVTTLSAGLALSPAAATRSTIVVVLVGALDCVGGRSLYWCVVTALWVVLPTLTLTTGTALATAAAAISIVASLATGTTVR